MKLLCTIALAAATVHAQPAPTPKFEVVSIKPCTPGKLPQLTQSPGRFTITCRTVLDLIRQSYITFANGSVLNLPAWQPPIENAPAWLSNNLYTIEAKAEGTPNQGTMLGPMMRALLADRFQLKIHTETKEIAVYNLTVAKSGAKLQPAQPGGCRPIDVDHPPAPNQPRIPICGIATNTPTGFDVRGVTMADLGRALRLDRPVIDKTNISGTFDFATLSTKAVTTLPPPPPPPPPPGSAPPPPQAGIAEAADTFAVIQNQLQKFGLKLESPKAPANTSS